VNIDIIAYIKRNTDNILLLAPLVAFAVPLAWMFLLNPASFDALWKGRTFQLFFVWLILLEFILGWEALQEHGTIKPTGFRLGALVVTLLLPTFYVVASNYFGLSAGIAAFSKQSGVYWYNDMPAAVEYFVFAGFFTLMAFLTLGLKGVKSFSIPILFSVVVGAVFIIDSVYPNDQFTPFQFLVPVTTMLAANVLGFMGYRTSLDFSQGNLPQLTVFDPKNAVNSVSFGIAWPCAGVESLLIFAVTILLFLKRMPLSWQAKLGYFVFGAAVTYGINVLRIAGIFLWALGGGDVNVFHQSYGPLFPIAWIVSYPLVILGVQSLRYRIKTRNTRGSLEKPDGVGGAFTKSRRLELNPV
jgi:thaumarchaeosortase